MEHAVARTIVNLAAITDFFEALRYHWCQGAVKLVHGNNKYGLVAKLSVSCDNCGYIELTSRGSFS